MLNVKELGIIDEIYTQEVLFLTMTSIIIFQSTQGSAQTAAPWRSLPVHPKSYSPPLSTLTCCIFFTAWILLDTEPLHMCMC